MPDFLALSACQRFHAACLPAEWSCEALEERIRLEYGEGLTEGERLDGPYPVFGSNGQVGTHNRFLVEGPGILVGRKGSVGEVHYTDASFWPIDTVYYVKRLKDDSWKYLAHLLGFLRLGVLNAATGVPGLSRRDTNKLRGAFPPRGEQDAIVDVVEVVDDLIEAAEGKRTAAQRLKTALMQQLFTRGILGQHTNWKPLQVFRQTYDIPSSWETARLASCIAQIDYGTNEPSNADKAGVPVIAIPQVVSARFGLKDCDYAILSADEAAALRLAPNDVLLVRTNGNSEYIGKSTVIGDEAEHQHIVFASYLIRIRTKPDRLLGRYLNYFLHSPVGRRQSQAMANTSAGNHNLGARSLRQFWIPRPGEKEQKEIVEMLDAVEDLLDSLETELEKARKLKTSLLQNLLTGKVRITMEG